MPVGFLMKNKIAIIGLGYVGLPLAISLSKHFMVTGIDHSKNRIDDLENNFDINKEVNSYQIKKSKIKFVYSSKIKKFSADIFIVTVPTPVNHLNKPNIKNLISACKFIGKYIKKKNLVIIESTVAPETTEKICLGIISKISGISKDKINICFSPERINPGDRYMKIKDITKIVSGNKIPSKKRALRIYKKINKKVVTAENIKSAELAKIIENAQRDINISFMNEIYKICDVYKLDYRHVLELCSTKWNFINFKPGLVGGHCVPVDPYYLIEDLKKKNYSSKLLKISRNNNEQFVKYITKKLYYMIKKFKKRKILYCGVNFKHNVSDKRNSKYNSIYLNLKKKYKCDLFLENKNTPKNINKYLIDYNIFIIGTRNSNIEKLQKKILSVKKSEIIIINILGKKINSQNKNIKIINI